MRRSMRIALVLVAVAATALPAWSALLSKSFQFKPGVTLELGVPAERGLRLDSVFFKMPAPNGRKFLKFGGQPSVEVTVSNGGGAAQKVGIAIAMFDRTGRLVGVASGGSKLVAIKPNRRSVYSLDFADVNDLLERAASFQISVEAR